MYRLYCNTVTSCTDHPGVGQVLCGVQGVSGGGHPPHPCPGCAGGQCLIVVNNKCSTCDSILTSPSSPSSPLPLTSHSILAGGLLSSVLHSTIVSCPTIWCVGVIVTLVGGSVVVIV